MSKSKVVLEMADGVVEKAYIVAAQKLKKQLSAMEAKLARRDEKIKKLQDGLDITQEKRVEIKNAAEKLVDLLDDAGWYDIDKYYDEF